jgi:hypothetical protein
VINLSGSNDHANSPCFHFENYNRSMVAARQQTLRLVRCLDIQVVATRAVCQPSAMRNKACSMDAQLDRPTMSMRPRLGGYWVIALSLAAQARPASNEAPRPVTRPGACYVRYFSAPTAGIWLARPPG